MLINTQATLGAFLIGIPGMQRLPSQAACSFPGVFHKCVFSLSPSPSALETPVHPAPLPLVSRAEVCSLLRSGGKFPAFSHLLHVAAVTSSAGRCQATQEFEQRDSTPRRGRQGLGPGVTRISFLACLRVLPSSPSPIHLLPPSLFDVIQQVFLSSIVSMEDSVRKNTHYFHQGADSPVKGFLELV